jgi:uncharacterized protein YecT (DUF1311 family)
MTLGRFLTGLFAVALIATTTSIVFSQKYTRQELENCKDAECFAEGERLDREMVKRELAKGKSPKQVVAERSRAGDYYARCPDTAMRLEEDCPFAEAMTELSKPGTASVTFDAAIEKCTEHPQTTINFCFNRVLPAAEKMVDKAYLAALSAGKAADAEKKAECSSGTGYACGGGMDHEKFLVAAQKGWEAYASNHCAYDTEANVGGSGYATFQAVCWMKLAAARIDQLSMEE